MTYDGKDYIWDKFYENIKNLSYPNYDILIIDNTAGREYFKLLKKRTKKESNIIVEHVLRGGTSREAQAKSLNRIREFILNNRYEYFMSIESDLIPPRDIIERLMCYKCPVVGTTYLIGYADSKTQPPRPCIFATRKGKNGRTETYNLKPHEGFAIFGTGLQQVHGCGLGCTLIKRSVLEKVRFWYILDPPPKHSDVLFYMDLHNMKIPIYMDTNLIVPHYNSDWKRVKDI